MKIWEPKPPGTLWAKPGLLRDSFTFFTIVSEMLPVIDVFVGIQNIQTLWVSKILLFYLRQGHRFLFSVFDPTLGPIKRPEISYHKSSHSLVFATHRRVETERLA